MTQLVLEIAGRTKPGKREDLLGLFETHLAPRAEANRPDRHRRPNRSRRLDLRVLSLRVPGARHRHI